MPCMGHHSNILKNFGTIRWAGEPAAGKAILPAADRALPPAHGFLLSCQRAVRFPFDVLGCSVAGRDYRDPPTGQSSEETTRGNAGVLNSLLYPMTKTGPETLLLRMPYGLIILACRRLRRFQLFSRNAPGTLCGRSWPSGHERGGQTAEIPDDLLYTVGENGVERL